MATDNFGIRVAEDPLGPRVPIGNMSLVIQEEDCVVRHAFHQKAMLLLHTPQRRLTQQPCGPFFQRTAPIVLLHRNPLSTVDTYRCSPKLCLQAIWADAICTMLSNYSAIDMPNRQLLGVPDRLCCEIPWPQ